MATIPSNWLYDWTTGTASSNYYLAEMQRRKVMHLSQSHNASSFQNYLMDDPELPKPKNNKITDEGLLNNLRREINEWINF
jgi:hypothetical protein